ncbi:hypothetical protein AVEN_211938-1 [Araneus ventricosus]|uniref:Uncharacterized protein n=1 Tax=Araneus ventricosus TaxID=182803 RepID=A0A4Y2PBE7_ARAVE|nr:hypothetical protein AVEN_211938-1 [Araneus ventricosus]
MTKPLIVSKNKQLDEQLLRMVVKEYQPFSLVEDAELKRFVHMLCPAYNLPRRKILSNNILQTCFVETMNKIKTQVLDEMTDRDNWAGVKYNEQNRSKASKITNYIPIKI